MIPKPWRDRSWGAGDLPRSLRSTQAGSSPVGETSQGAVGERTVETCLSICFPPAFSFYSFFLPRISGFEPQMEILFLWLTICLDHCQVKSWCLSSRDAATMVPGSLTHHTCEVGGVKVLMSGCKDTFRKLKKPI